MNELNVGELKNGVDNLKIMVEVIKTDVEWLKKGYWCLAIPIIIGIVIQVIK